MKLIVPKVIVEEKQMGSGGEAWLLREQTMVLDVPGKLTGIECRVRLQKGEEPFAPGEYGLDPSSFQGGKYGRIDFNPKPNRVPLSSTKPALAGVK